MATQLQLGGLDLLQQQTTFGFTAEDFDLIIESMAKEGKEPTFCMGDDIPLAILSEKPHLLYDYFKQRFAQVTNPPIDPLREKLVMSLEMNLGKRGSPLVPKENAFSVVHLKSPNLNENEYGHPLFADYFFFITGFHGFHVFSGVVLLIVILINVIKGTYE